MAPYFRKLSSERRKSSRVLLFGDAYNYFSWFQMIVSQVILVYKILIETRVSLNINLALNININHRDGEERK